MWAGKKSYWFQLRGIWSASKFNGFGHGGWFMIDLLTWLLWWFIFIFTQSFSSNNDYFLELLMRKSDEIPKSEMAIKISFCIFFIVETFNEAIFPIHVSKYQAFSAFWQAPQVFIFSTKASKMKRISDILFLFKIKLENILHAEHHHWNWIRIQLLEMYCSWNTLRMHVNIIP